jgi:hypothetical protein
MSTIVSLPSHHPFARGHSAVLFAQGMWVRAKASLITESGDLRIVLGLETDRLDFGPKGRAWVRLLDASGVELARVQMEQPIGIPGKAPGKARIEEFSLSVAVSAAIASRTASLAVSVTYDGKQFAPFGLPIEDIAQAIAVIVSAA